jgi:integrase
MLREQVNLPDGIVRLEPGETKNDDGRTVYMQPDLWKKMKVHMKTWRLGCPYVFHIDGKKIKECRTAWDKACTAIGKPDLLFHDLRRSALRKMIRAGIPERVAMLISGHKTRSVFDRYNITSQDDLKEAAQKSQAFAHNQARRLHFGYSRENQQNKLQP